MSNRDKLKNYIKELMREIQTELDESTTTTSVDGYQTPFAFGNKEDQKSRHKKLASLTGYTLAEVVNRYHELRKDESTPNQKIGRGIREIRHQLQEMEKFIEWYGKIKSESELESSDYWKRTQRHLNVIGEKINTINQKIKELTK